MLNFVKDVVHDLRLKKTDGTSSRGMRWHDSTKRLGGVLKKFGGPRCHRLQRLNVGGPSARTVERCWNRELFHYPTGDSDAVFALLAKELKSKMALLGLPEGEKLPCEFQFDETPVLQELAFSHSRDAVIGSCGWGGDNHTCDSAFAQRPECIIGDDDESAGKIDRLCAEAIRAGYLRLCVLKPLSKKLPRLIVSLSASCNRFNTVHVQEQWVELDKLFKTHLAPLGLTRSTHGSDGDARYFASQKVNMTHRVTWASGEATSHWEDPHKTGTPFRIEHEGFTISGLMLDDGSITNIEIQDNRHGTKKLLSWAFIGKALRRGNRLVTANHCVLVFQRFKPDRHHIRKQDAYRHDPQDFVGPTRLSSLGTRACLRLMQSVHTDEFDAGTQHPPVQTEGTVEYLELIANFTRIHLSLALSNEERVFLASDILNNLRFWRNHLHYTPGYTLKEHYMSRQTYEHITLECHSLMLHIKMFGVQCPSQPTDLEETGSDECEKTFRSFGGFSRTQGRRHNYNILDALDAAGDENQLNAWEGDQDSEVRLEYGRGNQSLEYDESLHEAPGSAAADLTIHPAAAALVDAFERGLQSARAKAVARGMVPPKGRLPTKPGAPMLTGEQLMQKPWLGEGHLVEQMREKADNEAEQEAAGGGGDEGRGGGGGGGGGSSGGGGDDAGAADGGGGGGDGDDDDGDGPPPPPQGSGGESAACVDSQRDAASTLLESVLALDADRQATARSKTSPLMTVSRDDKPMRVYKRTYLHETQQLDAGQKLPADRLNRIVAAASQTSKEVERAARSSSAPAADAAADAAADTAADDEPQPPQMLKLGSVVVLATSTASGRYDWWAGRVEKMKCTSSKAGRYVNTVTPTQFDQACSDKVKVICSWYRKHANYVFTYDGPVDDKEYNMENALGMLDLELPDAKDRYRLRDPSQGPSLDAALKLTEVPANKKRSRGDEMLAQQARVERESMPAAPAKRQRGAPTDRTAAFEGQKK